MIKKILFTAALVCLSLAASAKQYSFTLAHDVQVGTVKLAAGDYKLTLEGANATFTDINKKTFTAPVKVEKVAKKAEFTSVETKETKGVTQIDAIDFGGADFKLVF